MTIQQKIQYLFNQINFDDLNIDNKGIRIADNLSSDIEKEFAAQQLLAFSHCEHGYGLTDLVSSMGLTQEEWTDLKNDQAVFQALKSSVIADLDEYFKNQN